MNPEPATCATCGEIPRCKCKRLGTPIAWAPYHPKHGFDATVIRKRKETVERYIKAVSAIGFRAEPLFGFPDPRE